MTLGDMSVSILNAGAGAFQFIQRIESRYRIGGKRSMSPALAIARSGELSIPQAASDGFVASDELRGPGLDGTRWSAPACRSRPAGSTSHWTRMQNFQSARENCA